MMDEEDPKEYRWETGYEKTWYYNLFRLVREDRSKKRNICWQGSNQGG